MTGCIVGLRVDKYEIRVELHGFVGGGVENKCRLYFGYFA